MAHVMIESVYLETSVVSALFDQRKDSLCQVQHTQSREWLDQESLYYSLYGSSVVVDELQAGVYDHQAEALTFAKELSQLPLTDEVFGVARIYAEQLLMPKSSPGDALHLAAASIGEIDYLFDMELPPSRQPQ